jgi:hypothetical protein
MYVYMYACMYVWVMPMCMSCALLSAYTNMSPSACIFTRTCIHMLQLIALSTGPEIIVSFRIYTHTYIYSYIHTCIHVAANSTVNGTFESSPFQRLYNRQLKGESFPLIFTVCLCVV